MVIIKLGPIELTISFFYGFIIKTKKGLKIQSFHREFFDFP